MKKKTLFFAGLFSGLFIAQNWRVLSKGGIKIGIRAGRKLREVSQQAVEEFEDVTAEAIEEMAREEEQQEAVGER
jgi:DNA helicase IV